MNIRNLLTPSPISGAKGTKQGSGLGRTLCLAALFVTFATAAWADVDLTSNNFPDSKFLDIVKGRSINTNGDKKLSDAELQAVTTMDVSKKSIQNLKGIEYFTALTSLICYGNRLTQLDVSALKNLVTLECYDNSSMTSLNATGCTKLTTLKCNSCKLKTISLERCSNLQTLRCYKNNLRDDDMVQFISKLPSKRSITNLDLCYNNEDADAGNKIMHAEVRAAKAKNWIIRKYDGSWKKYTGIIAVDETTFPDANFLACVGQYDTDNDGILSDDEVAAVTRMYVDSKGIQDMTGIECFEKLTYLYCCKNQIRDQWADILISYLPTVEGGGLGFWDREPPTGNYLTQEQLEAFTAKGWNVYELKHGYDDEWVTYVPNNHTGIYIDETTFPDYYFRQKVIKKFDKNDDYYLSDEEVAEVKKIDLRSESYADDMKSFQGIEYFSQLEVLNCDDAPLTSLDLSGNPLLTSLTCKSYYLTSLDLSGNPLLTSLTCNYSDLTSIDLSGCPLLTELTLSGNFTSLNLSGCPLLTKVNVGGQIGSINISNHTQLTRFYTDRDSEVTSIDLSGCSQLNYIDVTRSKVVSINVSGCTQLEQLTADDNEITSIDLTGCNQLKYFFFKSNPMTSLNLSGLSSLKTITCYEGQLTSLDVSDCTSLSNLYCSDNPLTSINLSGCTEIESLNFNGLQLTSLNVSGCTNAKYVNINNNRLQGEAMDAFVESIPECSNPEYSFIRCLNMHDPAEENRLTPAQAAKLREKGWPVQALYPLYNRYCYLDYDGYGNGDVDGSGTVDADDVKAVVNHILGLTDTDTDVEMVAARAMEESATPFYSPIVADTNGDGVVDIADVAQIISKVGTVVYKKPEK